MDNRSKYLPIGTVVLLNGGSKKIMITGFCSISEDDINRVYDYCGCIYPEGYLNSNQVCLFDHNQINEIFYLGYENDEESEFKKELNQMLSEYNNDRLILIEENDDDEQDEDDEDDEEEELEYL